MDQPLVAAQPVLEGVFIRAKWCRVVVVQLAPDVLLVGAGPAPLGWPRETFGARGVILWLWDGRPEVRWATEQLAAAARRDVPAGLATTSPRLLRRPLPSPRASVVANFAKTAALFVAVPNLLGALAVRGLGLATAPTSATFLAAGVVAFAALSTGYLAIVRRAPEVRRMFQFNGALRMAFWTGPSQDLTQAQLRREPWQYHPQSTMVGIVLGVACTALLTALVTPHLPALESWWAKLGAVAIVELALLPVVTSIVTELQLGLRFVGSPLLAGPLLFDRLTAARPDDEHLTTVRVALVEIARLSSETVASAPATDDGRASTS